MFQEVEAPRFQDSRHMKVVKVVSPTHRPPLPPRKYSWYSFLLEAESTPGPIVRPEGLCQWKIPMTPSGIEPAAFLLVVQCLNQRFRYSTPYNRPWRHRGEYRYSCTLLFNVGARWKWVVNATPRPLYPRERPGTHCIGGRVSPRAGLDWSGNSPPPGIRSPDSPACSK